MWRQLREGAFLTRDRLRVYVCVLAVGMALTFAYGWSCLLLSHESRYLHTQNDQAGRPAVTDFLGFWSAARVAAAGAPARSYTPSVTTLLQRQEAALPPNIFVGFFYPPAFLLLCLPFAVLPYRFALVAFVALTGAIFFALLFRLFPRLYAMRLPVLAAFAFPAVVENAVAGQTGFLIGASLAGGALFLEQRPAIAGVCLGFCVCKPHLALCMPVALVCARRWRAAVACGLTACALIAVSVLLLGIDSWQGFLSAAPLAKLTLEQDQADWGKSFSVFTGVRLMHDWLPAAYVAQAVVAVVSIVLVAGLSWRRPGGTSEISVLTVASLSLPPHVLDYDLVCLLVPMGWIVTQAVESGWLAWERVALLCVFLCGLLGREAALGWALPLGPAGLLVILAMVVNRALRTRAYGSAA